MAILSQEIPAPQRSLNCRVYELTGSTASGSEVLMIEVYESMPTEGDPVHVGAGDNLAEPP